MRKEIRILRNTPGPYKIVLCFNDKTVIYLLDSDVPTVNISYRTTPKLHLQITKKEKEMKCMRQRSTLSQVKYDNSRF